MGERCLAAVEPAVVVVGEEMAVGVVAYDPHVDPVALLRGEKALCNESGGAVGVEDFRSRPACRVGDVWVGAVCRIAVLVDEVPELLGSEVDFEVLAGDSFYSLPGGYGFGRMLYLQTSGAAL